MSRHSVEDAGLGVLLGLSRWFNHSVRGSNVGAAA
jgi:hypothetical protein